MTLIRHPHQSQLIPMPGLEVGLDQRAVDLGKLIKSKRLDLGLNRPAFVREMARHGEEITPDYLNKLESGVNSLTRASLKVREGIRIVLGYTTEEWQKATGLYISADAAKPAVAEERRYELPAALQQMIEERSHLDPSLQEHRWQDYLRRQRFSSGSATADRYWNLFLLLKNAGIEPGGN